MTLAWRRRHCPGEACVRLEKMTLAGVRRFNVRKPTRGYVSQGLFPEAAEKERDPRGLPDLDGSGGLNHFVGQIVQEVVVEIAHRHHQLGRDVPNASGLEPLAAEHRDVASRMPRFLPGLAGIDGSLNHRSNGCRGHGCQVSLLAKISRRREESCTIPSL